MNILLHGKEELRFQMKLSYYSDDLKMERIYGLSSRPNVINHKSSLKWKKDIEYEIKLQWYEKDSM